MKKFTIIIIIITGFCYSQYRYGTTSANFLEIGPSSSAVAMGGAYVSLANDAISAYWNPAGLANVSELEIGVSSQNWVAGIRHFSTTVALSMGNYGTISVYFTDFDYGSTEVTNINNQDGTGEYYNANELATSIGYARNLVDWFSFGASLKVINSNIWHSSARATALDLGVIVKTNYFSKTRDRNNGLRIGMSISNYGTQIKYDGIDLINPIDILENENGNYENVIGQYRTESWELPLIFRLGASIKPIVTNNQSLTISSDVLHPNNNSESINSGLQYCYKLGGGNTFYIRSGIKGIGIAQANKRLSASGIYLPFSSLTYGVGFDKKFVNNQNIGIDYSFQSIGLLGDVSLITIRFNLF
jgi:hypothetical protein